MNKIDSSTSNHHYFVCENTKDAIKLGWMLSPYLV